MQRKREREGGNMTTTRRFLNLSVYLSTDFIYLASAHTMEKEGMQFRFNRCILIELIRWLEKVQR